MRMISRRDIHDNIKNILMRSFEGETKKRASKESEIKPQKRQKLYKL
jgi:hypothetical protein